MQNRYIVSYDICDDARLRAVYLINPLIATGPRRAA